MKREIIISRLLRVLLVPGLMLILAAPATAFARENIPVSIDIPVTYIVSGNDKTAGGDTFTLTPDDPAAPMPPEQPREAQPMVPMPPEQLRAARFQA